jgi:hypothetical protein
MFRSPTENAIKTIKYLNVNNAIFSLANAQLVATARASKQRKKGKQIINKARVLSKANADQLRMEMEAKKAANEAHKDAMEQKKKEQGQKKAKKEAAKVRRAIERAQAKDTREKNAEMTRMGRVDRRLFL